MDNNNQFFTVRDRGGGAYISPARVVEMEPGGKVIYDSQLAGMVGMATTDNSMNDVIRMKEKDRVYTPAHLGITGKHVIQMPTKEVIQDMEMEDTDEPVVDLASSRGFKTGGDDLQWRDRKRVEEVQSPNADDAMFVYNDEIIDMKVAKKKVIPAEARDESNKVVEMPEVRHKIPPRLKIAQKRPLLSSDYKDEGTPASPGVWMESEMENKSLKAAASLIKDIQNKTARPQCINLNPEMFTGFDQLEKRGVVGQGSFGQVIKVKDVKKGHMMIMKKVKMIEKNEILIPLQFPYQDSLARIFGFSWDGEDAQLVQEDAGISLRNLVTVEKRQLLEEDGQTEKILLDIFKGISILARHGITHCDIKPENVCLNLDTLRAKLIDLGSSKTSQDSMTYKGITPEYLPPGPNKFCYDYLVCGKRSIQAPRLGEKDDVWAGALVGLFLMTRVHPMIKWATTLPDYLPHIMDEEKERLRNKVMERISRLCDEPSQFPDSPHHFPIRDVVKQLLTTKSYTKKLPNVEKLLEKVLVVDESKRPTSAEVVNFLQKKLGSITQPPMKAVKRCDSVQVDDIEIDVDIKIAKKQVQDAPSQDQCTALGVAFKPAAAELGTNILTPSKITFQPQRQIKPSHGSSFAAPQQYAATTATPPMRHTQNQSVNLWKKSSEAAEYESLVESFNVSAKVTPGPVQQVTRHVPQPVQYRPTGFFVQSQGFSQRSPTSGYQDMDMSKRRIQTSAVFHPQKMEFAQRSPTSGYQDMDISKHRVQRRHQSSYMQDDDDSVVNSPVAIKGLFGGNTLVFSKGREVVGALEPQSEGNVPNMDALMSGSFGDGEDMNRPKLKGRRRNNPNY